MKQTFILLFILGSFSAAFAQKSNTTPVISRYYYFTGTIDKYPVAFHLYRINNEFSGTYYYNSTEEPIDISGELDKNRFLKLTHRNEDGKETEVLSGNFKDSSFSGTWSFKGKLLPFRVAQPKGNSALSFDYIYTYGEKKLAKEEFGRTELEYSAAAIWPVAASQHPATNLIKQIIFDIFEDKVGQGEIGKAMIREKNEILNPVKKEDEPVTYDLHKIVQVDYRTDKLLSISSFTYVDGGGAHPNHGTTYYCIDLVHNRKLAITDVLDTLACLETLHSLLAKKFRTAFNLKKEEKIADYLFEEIIPPGTNFMVTSKGIAFHYNPYAIGAYALGDVHLYIPFSELQSCLKPAFKQLIPATP
jgi:hypothetical protein